MKSKQVINSFFLIFLWVLLAKQSFGQSNNLSLLGDSFSSSDLQEHPSEFAMDGNHTTWWSPGPEKASWLMVRLPGATEIVKIVIVFHSENLPVGDFRLQKMHNGTWQDIKNVQGNKDQQISLELGKAVLTDRIRFFTGSEIDFGISELAIYGQEYVDSTALDVKKILVNQSGYNLNRPKRFSAPSLDSDATFSLSTYPSNEIVFKGKLKDHVGDFSAFNPSSGEEYVIRSQGEESFPFRIENHWMERVSYRNLIDFMIGARHYVGTTDEIRRLSWAWRDGDFFNWAQQSLVSLFLSNPEAFENMDQTIHYITNASFPQEYRGKWGALEPYSDDTPDLVQLIHWDADVKISQGLDHEMQKAELAYFLYAWPYLKKWLPQQNFDRVYDYLRENWEKETVSTYSTTQYDQSPSHNLLSLKTKLGTTKGELPPGHSVIPNLLFYEVALSQGAKDAQKYFDAAYRQLEWMIQNLDWNDPMTTKGQRMSEHVTLRAFEFFYSQYPDSRPRGIREKVKEWAEIMISRSGNYWDFRKYSDEEWTPPSWNETGNILGFPAAVFAAMMVLQDQGIKDRLEEIAWAHLDNAFGRNPTGRHFSYRGPQEIEGVDLGWYSYHIGGIGLLDDVKFVFDGSPKSFHYPNHPEVGNLGWTEGWVQFNTAFNMSIAYMARYYNELTLEQVGEHLMISLQAPIYGNSRKKKSGMELYIDNGQGETLLVNLIEQVPGSAIFQARLQIQNEKLLSPEGEFMNLPKQELHISYGLGYMKKVAIFKIEQ